MMIQFGLAAIEKLNNKERKGGKMCMKLPGNSIH